MVVLLGLSREGFLGEAVSDQICWVSEGGLHVAQFAIGEPLDSSCSAWPFGGAVYYGSINDKKVVLQKRFAKNQYNRLMTAKLFFITVAITPIQMISINILTGDGAEKVLLSRSHS